MSFGFPRILCPSLILGLLLSGCNLNSVLQNLQLKQTTTSTTTSTTNGAATSSQQCPGSPNAAIKESTQRALASYSPTNACEGASHYACESKTLSSEVTSTTLSSEEQCAEIDGMGHVCLSVDTTVVPTPSGLENQKVVHCSNITIKNNSGFLFQSIGDSLESSLSAAVAKCRNASL